jgi:hypothetical protein
MWKLGALITFAALFGLVRVFERGRDDLGNFQIGMVAVVPVVVAVITTEVLGLLYPQPVLMMVVSPLVHIGVTFFLLYKNLEIPIGRSIAYTVAVVTVNQVLAVILASG